jgi:translation initiation factor IF-1
MGKNLTGGGKTKGQARKRANPTNGNTNMVLRMPENEYEIFACVTKMFGNGRISVVDNKNKEFVGIIRGKMKGRSKRHNIITVGTIVLAGLREWEGPTNFIHVDVLEIYDNSQTNQIHKIPNSNITNLISIRDNLYNLNPSLKNSHTNNEDGILFDENHTGDDDDDDIENKIVFGGKGGKKNGGEEEEDEGDEVPAQKLPPQDFNMIDFDDI